MCLSRPLTNVVNTRLMALTLFNMRDVWNEIVALVTSIDVFKAYVDVRVCSFRVPAVQRAHSFDLEIQSALAYVDVRCESSKDY
jgi:hypothetical protein